MSTFYVCADCATEDDRAEWADWHEERTGHVVHDASVLVQDSDGRHYPVIDEVCS